MIIHVKKHGAVVELEAGDRFTRDEELEKMLQSMPAPNNAGATHAMRVMVPAQAAQEESDSDSDFNLDCDCKACGTSAFVQLSLH
jgi:hypothetical protein